MKKLFGKLFKNDSHKDTTASSSSRRTSKNVAKERLKLALTYDRGELAPTTIDQLRDEILQVIAKHLNVNNDDIDIQLDRSPEYDKLVASIPLRATNRPRAVSSKAKHASPTPEPTNDASLQRAED